MGSFLGIISSRNISIIQTAFSVLTHISVTHRVLFKMIMYIQMIAFSLLNEFQSFYH